MSEAQSSADVQHELARQRTEIAIQRTVLAEQRTYSAWVRTGLASAATGFALAKFLSDSQPAALVLGLATTFVVSGGAMFLVAYWAYRSALLKLETLPQMGIPLWVLGLLSLALFISTMLGLILIF